MGLMGKVRHLGRKTFERVMMYIPCACMDCPHQIRGQTRSRNCSHALAFHSFGTTTRNMHRTPHSRRYKNLCLLQSSRWCLVIVVIFVAVHTETYLELGKRFLEETHLDTILQEGQGQSTPLRRTGPCLWRCKKNFNGSLRPAVRSMKVWCAHDPH